MKKIIILFSIFILTVLSFTMNQNVLAETKDKDVINETSSGITPDSYFYFIDRLGEKLQEFFTFNKQSKIKLQVKFAKERVAEINFLVSQDKKIDTEAINKAKDLLLENVAMAANFIKEEKMAGKEIAQLAKETDDALDKQEEILLQSFFKARKELSQNRLKVKEQLLQQAREVGDSEQIAELDSEIKELINIDGILKTEKEKIKKELRNEKKNIEKEMDEDDQKQDNKERIDEDKQEHEDEQEIEEQEIEEQEIEEQEIEEQEIEEQEIEEQEINEENEIRESYLHKKVEESEREESDDE